MNDNFRHFQSDKFNLMVTPEGMERIKLGKMSIRETVKKYGDAVRNSMKDKPERMYMKSGGNGDVFAHMGDYAVKEIKGQTSYFSLGRMNKIGDSLRRSKDVQAFARAPEYYGIYTDKKTGKEYLLMERIDVGLKVQDIIDGATDISDEIKRAILNDYSKLKKFVEQHDSSKKLFTDFHEGNVLVDFSKNQNKQSYTLVVVDQ